MSYRQQYKPNAMKSAECPKCKSTTLLYGQGKLTCRDCGHTIGKTFNKYGAKRTEFNGHRYDSKFEAQIAEDLDLRLKAKDIKKVDRQVKIALEAYGKRITNYYIDFIITHNDDHLEYLEVKGYETDVWKMKWKMLEAKVAQEDPGAEMTVLKQSNRRR
jgi:uncharacterized Zn finger protein (UPF0148 family)